MLISYMILPLHQWRGKETSLKWKKCIMHSQIPFSLKYIFLYKKVNIVIIIFYLSIYFSPWKCSYKYAKLEISYVENFQKLAKIEGAKIEEIIVH